MRKIKYICFSLFLLLIFINITYADTCDSNDIKRLREIANNVTVGYSLNQEAVNNNEYDTFDVEVNGLTEDIYIYFDNYPEHITYNDTDNGSVVFDYFYSGNFKLYIISYYCGTVLRTIDLNIPIYNTYSLDDRCKEDKYKDLDICDEWHQWDTFDVDVESYFQDDMVLSKDTVMDFFKKYYYIIGIIGVILIIFIILIIIKRRKRWSLE